MSNARVCNFRFTSRDDRARLLAFLMLAALTVVAVLLMREVAGDYYRRSDKGTAPDWSSFTA
jgi:hypothetical protein